ncbi:voltage-dependent T-type calcium channel subunit alpha-1I [Lates japonicus]|uniref:Voltage-dependent T-type calcium channel subunit alpha-1I n=1 Tax=Lates japonicus TaxID=270547 RepID=A0AAD3NCK3_LATJO|nr:voltage-dependent T-type calcium channel subunit alpha-1I [Lates japonicus]
MAAVAEAHVLLGRGCTPQTGSGRLSLSRCGNSGAEAMSAASSGTSVHRFATRGMAPHKIAASFDNVYAWIVIFQIGSFFMINLCLVVIATQFSETKQREHQLMQEQRAQCLSSSTLASMAEPGDCYEEIFQLVCHVLRKAKRRSAALYYTLRGKPPPAGGGRGNRRGGGNVNGERHHSRHPRCE